MKTVTHAVISCVTSHSPLQIKCSLNVSFFLEQQGAFGIYRVKGTATSCSGCTDEIHTTEDKTTVNYEEPDLLCKTKVLALCGSDFALKGGNSVGTGLFAA